MSYCSAIFQVNDQDMHKQLCVMSWSSAHLWRRRTFPKVADGFFSFIKGTRLCPGHSGYRWASFRLQLQQAKRGRLNRGRHLTGRWAVRRRRRLHGRVFRLPDLRRCVCRPRPPRASSPDPAQRRAELSLQLQQHRGRPQLFLRSALGSIRRSVSSIRSAQLQHQSGGNRSGGHQTGHPGGSVQPDFPGSGLQRLSQRTFQAIRQLRSSLLSSRSWKNWLSVPNIAITISTRVMMHLNDCQPQHLHRVIVTTSNFIVFV